MGKVSRFGCVGRSNGAEKWGKMGISKCLYKFHNREFYDLTSPTQIRPPTICGKMHMFPCLGG